jgi:hypothetical protein
MALVICAGLVSAACVAVVVVSARMIMARRRHIPMRQIWRQALAVLVGVMIGSISASILTVLTMERRVAALALDQGTAAVAEGVVQVLHQQAGSGHDRGDELMIGDAHLVVDAYGGRSAYRKTVSCGGVLVPGASVRVYHVGPDILRIERRAVQTTSQPEVRPAPER